MDSLVPTKETRSPSPWPEQRSSITTHRRAGTWSADGRRGRDLVFGISRTRYYAWKRRADAYGLTALVSEGPPGTPDAQASPTRVVERLLTLAVLDPPSAFASMPTASATWASRSPSPPSRRCWSPTAWAAAGAPGPGGGHRGGHLGPAHRGGPGGGPLRVLPGHGRARRAGLPGQLLRREPEGCREGVPVHRHRRVHPLGLLGPSSSARSASPTPPASSTRCWVTTGATGSPSEPCSPTAGPNT